MPKTSLVQSLNNLLASLHIPIPLQSPTDLTPSLLLAIVSSLLRTRIPPPSSAQAISQDERQLQITKLFLGVLQTDVLPPHLEPEQAMDTGVTGLDPVRIVRGKWDELVFLGELLCWVARRQGVLVESDFISSSSTSEVRPVTPSNSASESNVTQTVTPTGLSLHSWNRPFSSATEFTTPPRGRHPQIPPSSPSPSSSSRSTITEKEEPVNMHWSYETCPILPTIPHIHPSLHQPSSNIQDDDTASTSSSAFVLADGYMTRVDDTLDSRGKRTKKVRKKKRHEEEDKGGYLRLLTMSHHRLLEERARLLEGLAAVRVNRSSADAYSAG